MCIDTGVAILIKVLVRIVIGALIMWIAFVIFKNTHPELAQKIIDILTWH